MDGKNDTVDGNLRSVSKMRRNSFILVSGVRSMPKVLNKRTDAIPEGAVFCGRPTRWGNPFRIGIDGTREQVVDRFEHEVLPTLNVSSLRGKDLVCFCAPLRCHCDAILIKANALLRSGKH